MPRASPPGFEARHPSPIRPAVDRGELATAQDPALREEELHAASTTILTTGLLGILPSAHSRVAESDDPGAAEALANLGRLALARDPGGTTA